MRNIELLGSPDTIDKFISVFAKNNLAGNTIFELLRNTIELIGEEVPSKENQEIIISDLDQGITDVQNNQSLPPGIGKLVKAAIQSLEGVISPVYYYEEQEGIYYEDAATTIESIPDEVLESAVEYISSNCPPDISINAGGELIFEPLTDTKKLKAQLVFSEACLWSRAGMSYLTNAQLGTDGFEDSKDDVIRCCKKALQLLNELGNNVPDFRNDEQWQTSSTLTRLYLAGALIGDAEKWEECVQLYDEALDVAFFNCNVKGKVQYKNACLILATNSADIAPWDGLYPCPWSHEDRFIFEDVIIYEFCKLEDVNLTRFMKLKAEKGTMVLETIRSEYSDGWELPQPEVTCLLATLSQLYLDIEDYEKCRNLIGDTKFDIDFMMDCSYRLHDAFGASFAFRDLIENIGFARGRLNKPDEHQGSSPFYADFYAEWKASQEKMRLDHAKMIHHMENLSIPPSLAKVRDDLTSRNPWLDSAVDRGSIDNAILVYRNLKANNWGEVVAGFTNSVEAELKLIWLSYQQYLKIHCVEEYRIEINRTGKSGSRSALTRFSAYNKKTESKWFNNFFRERTPNNNAFVISELPEILDELANPRLSGDSRHGKMKDEEKAERAREIVLGTGTKKGLLEKLVATNEELKNNK